MNSNTTKKNHLMRVITVIALMCVLLLSTALIASATETETEAATEVTIVKEGTCGPGLTWTFDSEDTLTVSGEGSFDDFMELAAQPWASFRASIKKLVLEEGVISVGRFAFYGCAGIAEVEVPSTLMSLGEYAFFGCSALTSFDIPENLFSIGDYAFRRVGFVTVNVANPDNWTRYSSTLGVYEENIDLSDPSVAATMFKGTLQYYEWYRPLDKDAEATIIASGDASDNISWSLNTHGVLTISGEGEMPRYRGYNMPWYQYRGAVESIVIEDGITAIGRCSFYSFNTLRSVEIASTVTALREYAFYKCINLPTVDIDNNILTIETFVFRRCTALNEINFETVYGWSAGTIALEPYELVGHEINFMVNGLYHNKVWTRDTEANTGIIDVTVVDYGFCGTSGVKWRLVEGGYLVINGNGSMPDYDSNITLHPWKEYKDEINTVIIESGVEALGNCAFMKHSALSEVIIYKGLTTIAGFAFAETPALEEITIPSTVKTIKGYAFRQSALASATFNDTIGWSAGKVELSNVDLDNPATAASYLVGADYRSKVWTNADPTPDNPEVSEDPAESPLPPLSGTIEVVTTNSYGYNEEYYTFLPRTTSTYTFILPAGLGFYSKAEFDVYGNAEVGFYDNVAGTSFSVDLEAGVAYEFYVGATVEDSWTIEWTLGEPEEDPNAGVIGENATNLYLGSNTVYVNASDIENGTLNFAFEVTEAGNYSFNSMMLWASVYDADGNAIYDNYLVPGVYTVSIDTAWVNLGTYEMIVEYSYPSLEVGENTVTFEEADLTDGLQYSFYASKAGTYQFAVDGGMAIIFDANGQMISRVMSWLETGDYIIKVAAFSVGEHVVNVTYTAPTLVVGDNTISVNADQAAWGGYFYYEFTATVDGFYNFVNTDGACSSFYVYDMEWNTPEETEDGRVLVAGTTYMVEIYTNGEIEAGDYTVTLTLTTPEVEPEEPPIDDGNIDADGWTEV